MKLRKSKEEKFAMRTMRVEFMDEREEGALAVVVSLQKFMSPLPPAPPIPAHAKTSPQKGDISNEVRRGTFLTRFDRRFRNR
jgi:hypothetical protein